MFNVRAAARFARLRSVPRQPNPQRKEQHQENSRSFLPFSFSPCSLIKGTRLVSGMLARRVLPKEGIVRACIHLSYAISDRSISQRKLIRNWDELVAARAWPLESGIAIKKDNLLKVGHSLGCSRSARTITHMSLASFHSTGIPRSPELAAAPRCYIGLLFLVRPRSSPGRHTDLSNS